MNMVANNQVVLNGYVQGYPKESDFEMKSSETSCRLSGGGAILLKNLYLSCDPYMRHRMSKNVSHPGTVLHSYTPGSVIEGYGVAKVIESTHPDYTEGELVWGLTGWEQRTIISNPVDYIKIKPSTDSDPDHVPLSFHLGVLGIPGITAYFGFFKTCCPKKGETVYVSSACGGVGQLVGQFAKMAGCYVVGSASTQDKVNLVKHKFGFDDAFNYKEQHDLGATLKRYFPEGIDIYFDNVGGQMLDEVLLHMKPHGRIAASGMISQYNLEEPEGLRNLFAVIPKRLEIKGFAVIDFKQAYQEYLEDFAVKKLKERELVYVEDVVEGLENASFALVGIFHGRNIGRQIIRVAAATD